MNTPELRERCATQLQAAASRVSQMSAFIGLDGFVDEILHVVDKREDAEKYLRLSRMAQWGERIRAAAAGIGGFFVKTGVATKLTEGKETREIGRASCRERVYACV